MCAVRWSCNACRCARRSAASGASGNAASVARPCRLCGIAGAVRLSPDACRHAFRGSLLCGVRRHLCRRLATLAAVCRGCRAGSMGSGRSAHLHRWSAHHSVRTALSAAGKMSPRVQCSPVAFVMRELLPSGAAAVGIIATTALISGRSLSGGTRLLTPIVGRVVVYVLAAWTNQRWR